MYWVNIVALCLFTAASQGKVLDSTVAEEESCYIDICLAIDRSETINTTEWQQMLNFVSQFSATLDIENTNTKVGLVSFDQISTLDIRLKDHDGQANLQEDIEGQAYGGNGRDISLGLFRMRADCFTRLNGDREEVVNYAVVITNGESDHEDAVREADLLRETGTTIITIGVGPNANQALLLKIAGDQETHVYHRQSFADLEQHRNLILDSVCPGFGNFPKLEGPISVTVAPLQGNEFSMECSFNYSDSQGDSARYHVIFYHNDITPIGSPVILQPPEKSAFLPGSVLAGRLGKNVTCEVYTYWNESNELGPPQRPAMPYYAGLLISTKSVDVSEVDHSSTGGAPSEAEVHLSSTIPILCPDQAEGECFLKLDTRAPSSIVTTQAYNASDICSMQLTLSDWSPGDSRTTGNKPLKIKATQTLVTAEAVITGDVTLNVANGQGAIYDMWRNHPALKIKVNIQAPRDEDTRPYCHSITDPHIVTFDTKSYDVHDPGIYDLFYNRHEKIQTRIQMMHEACSAEKTNCQKNCGVAMSFLEDNRQNFIYMVTRCNTEDNAVRILQCQTESPDNLNHPVTASADRTKYYIRSGKGIVVTIVLDPTYVSVYVDAPRRTGIKQPTCGLCGGHDGNPDNDFYYCGEIEQTFEEFLLDTKIYPNETSLFECPEGVYYEYNITDRYCMCDDDGPLCLETDIMYKDDEEFINPSVPSYVVERENRRRLNTRSTDNIDYEYTPPVPDSSPITNPQPPPWGTFNITEQEAEDHCIATLTISPSYATCASVLTPADQVTLVSDCKFDIQIMGDLSQAANHLANLAQKCEFKIRTNVTVADPENPFEDPQFKEMLGAFLNTTCPNNCSTHGLCNLGVCVCQSGWIGPDCGVDQNTPPNPIRFMDPAVCDVFTRQCQSVKIEAKQLVNSELLSCRVTIDKDDGTTSESTNPGQMPTLTTVTCPLPDLLTLGDLASPIMYNYTVELSNNQEIFTPVKTNESRVVWQSDWYWPRCVESGIFVSKLVSCVIDDVCMMNGTANPDSVCEICSPADSSTEWTKNVDEETNLSPWSNYSDCTKNCDYGLRSRSRFCEVPDQTCCGYGPLKEESLCNTDNCAELIEEERYGVIVYIAVIPMLEWVQKEDEFDDIVTGELNEYTRQNPAQFCQSFYLQPMPDVTDPGNVLYSSDTRVACSYPRDAPSSNITTKLITELDVTRVETVCITDGETGSRIMDADYMVVALANLETVLEQLWELELDVVLTPQTTARGLQSPRTAVKHDPGSLADKPIHGKHHRHARGAPGDQCTRS